MWEQIGTGFVQHYYQQFDTDRVKLADLYVSELLRVNDCQWTSLSRMMSVKIAVLFCIHPWFLCFSCYYIPKFYACMPDYDIHFFSLLDRCFLFDMGRGGISRESCNHDQIKCKLPYLLLSSQSYAQLSSWLSLTQCSYLQSLPFQTIQHSITAQDHHPTPDSCVMSMVMGQLKVRCDDRLHLLKQFCFIRQLFVCQNWD